MSVVFDLLDDGGMSRLKLKRLNASDYCATAAAVPPLQINDGVLLAAFGRAEKLNGVEIDLLVAIIFRFAFVSAIS